MKTKEILDHAESSGIYEFLLEFADAIETIARARERNSIVKYCEFIGEPAIAQKIREQNENCED